MVNAVRTYRQIAADSTLRACTEKGIALFTDGGNIHAVPTKHIAKYPGLLFLVRRYAREIGEALDGRVE